MSHPAPRVTRVVLVFFAGTLGIAFAAIFVRLALPAPPVVTGFYRMLFASGALAVWVASARRGSWPTRGGLLLAAAAGACFGTDLAFWHVAITRTSVANATLLVNTTPLYVGLYTVAVLRRPLSGRFVSGAAVALAGAAILLGVGGIGRVGDGGASGVGHAGSFAGEGLALVAALFYAGYLLLMTAARRGVDAPAAVLAASSSATAVLGLYALALGDPFRGFPVQSWAAFAGAALVSQVGGVMAIAWALRFLPATFSSVGLLAQPTGTAILGWWLLGESISPLQGLGGVAVLAGIALASRAVLPATAAAPDPS